MENDQVRVLQPSDDSDLLASIIVARVVAQNLLIKAQRVDLSMDDLELQLDRLLGHLQTAESIATRQTSRSHSPHSDQSHVASD